MQAQNDQRRVRVAVGEEVEVCLLRALQLNEHDDELGVKGSVQVSEILPSGQRRVLAQKRLVGKVGTKERLSRYQCFSWKNNTRGPVEIEARMTFPPIPGTQVEWNIRAH